MAEENDTQVTEFILLGFTDRPALQLPLFLVFLAIYAITLLGNLGMMLLIGRDPRLHTPMYNFLRHLSFCDLCYSSAITPKMLANLLVVRKSISFAGCFTQMYFASALGTPECFLLAVMVYDRYAAVCNPLSYTAMMSPRVCAQLLSGSYITAFTHSLIHLCVTERLSFCDSNVISHFFCDVPPLLALSCSDTHLNEMIIFTLSGLIVMGMILVILLSYVYILAAVLRIHSLQGRYKAFSTCASHLTAVTLFYGTIIFMYLRPTANYSLALDQLASVFYTVVIPMLNPLIYSLRNKEVKEALWKVCGGKLPPLCL